MARNGFPDIEQLRLTQDFSSPANTKKMLLTVEVRKPNRQEFFRVRPGAEWQLATYVLEVKERQKRELYLVHSDLWEELRADIVARILFTTINRAGVVFLWPVGLPNKDGSFNHWFRSAYEAAQLAMTTWVRATSDTDRCVYDIYKANGDLPDPEWPEEDFQTLVHRAFKNRFIATTKHPVLRRLRGER